MQQVFLGTGGNLGNKAKNFKKVNELIESKLGKIKQSSSIYETPPWGFEATESFWNQVVLIETNFSPEKLLNTIHEIETLFDRERKGNQYQSREMDIDILYYDDIVLETGNLIIPHPLLHRRKFVLVPLTEIAPDFKHPVLRLTSLKMLDVCPDESVVKKIEDE
jgi:2-amino-4-hydroxy-6-hydroxymethyldihydropteridine diphosphokinase